MRTFLPDLFLLEVERRKLVSERIMDNLVSRFQERPQSGTPGLGSGCHFHRETPFRLKRLVLNERRVRGDILSTHRMQDAGPHI